MGSHISGPKQDSKAEFDDDDKEPVLKFPWYHVKEAVTSEDIANARASWALVQENRAEAYNRLPKRERSHQASCGYYYCTQFYKHVFDKCPESKVLFKNTDMEGQAMMLFRMITFLIGRIDEGEALAGTLKGLAVRHVGYGVKSRFYGIFGEVLLMTLEEVLGTDFTAEVSQAWIRIYSSMVAVMLPAAVEEEQRLWLMRYAKDYQGAEDKSKPSANRKEDYGSCLPFTGK
jgi:hemoglobin-like flavoprotein